MDNVRFHHCGEILVYLNSINVTPCFLLSYFPDLNPIENVFSCIKANLNKIIPRVTNGDELKNNIVAAMQTIDYLEIITDLFGPE